MKKVIALIVVWRIALFVVAAFSPSIIPIFKGSFPYYQERLISTNLPHFIWAFGNFDGVHYLGIAKSGYAAQFTQAFFPVYPVLIHYFSYLTGGNLLISALLISNISFFFGMLLFYKLIKKYKGEKKALWSCVFLLSFPTSFYFGAIYTEGLFFFMIMSCLMLQEQKKPFLAALVGSVSSGTRLIGSLLALTFISKKPKSLLYVGLVFLGLLFYMVYLQINFHNALYFLTAQSIFGQNRETQTIVTLPQVFFRYFKILLTTEGAPFFNALFEITTTVGAITLLILSFKKVKTSWVLFNLISILLPTLTGTLASMPRYIIIAFPIYVVMAEIRNTYIKIALLLIFLSFSILSLAFFSQGYWVA